MANRDRLTAMLSVLLALAVIAGLLIVPVPTSAGTLSWTAVAAPSTTGNVLIAGSPNWLMDVAPDGKTIFAYDNASLKLCKSTNGGLSWSTSGVGSFFTELGAPFSTSGLSNPTIVAMAISPNYEADSIVLLADAGFVYRSTNGGATFTRLPAPNVGTISSVDIGPYYTGGNAILVGGSSGAALAVEFGFVAVPGLQGVDVLAAAISPNNRFDNELLFVTANASGVFLRARVAANPIDSTFLPALIRSSGNYVMAALSRRVSIAFPADYNASSNNRTFVGLGSNGSDAVQDVYRVILSPLPGPSFAADLNVRGTGTSANVYSLSFKGSLTAGWLFVGLQDSTVIYRATGTGSTPSFTSSTRSPGGTTNTIVAASQQAGDQTVCAITNGPGSAFAISTDNGANFFDSSLFAVASGGTSILDFATVDANTTFLILTDSAGLRRLFQTTDAGTNWRSISTPIMTGIKAVFPSPNYATDRTNYIIDAGGKVWKSVDAGLTFTGITAPGSADVLSFVPIDGTDYLLGTTAGVFRSGASAAGTGTAGAITSFARINSANLFVGTSTGQVFYSSNDGISFIQVKPGAKPFVTGPVHLLSDVSFATNKTIYAGGAGGIARISVDTGTAWTSIFSQPVNRLVMGTEGTLYAAAANGNSVYRSVEPTATVPTFEKMSSPAIPGWPATATQTIDLQVFTTGTPAVPANTLWALADVPTGDQVLSFTDTLLSAPIVTSPANGSKVKPNFDFRWAPPAGATSFQIKYATDPAFVNSSLWPVTVGPGGVLVPSSATGDSVRGPTFLPRGQQVWWKVQGVTPLYSKASNTATFFTTDVPLRLNPASVGPISVGDIFNLEIRTNAPGTQAIGEVGSFLNFDPAKLEVIDSDAGTPGTQIVPGTALSKVLTNKVDNVAGTIDYSAGKVGNTNYPTGSFVVATIHFRAKAFTRPNTGVVFSFAGPRETTVLDNNVVPLEGTHGDAAITIPASGFLPGDANLDGFVNMGDVTKVELIILGLADMTEGADANGDGLVNMGDVTKVELIILGLA